MNRSLSHLPKHRFLSGTIRKVLMIAILGAALPLLAEIQPSAAQTCNVFGCSQPGASACNPFGCPNPGAAPCSPFGCPTSPAPVSAPPVQPSVIYQPQPSVIYPPQQQPQIGGSPQAIADCMKKLMYERKLVCTRTGFPGCSNFPSEGFGGWQTQNVRTSISETAVVQACQNAR